MADSALTPEAAYNISASFLTYYYAEFVKQNDLGRVCDLYDEHSYMTMIDLSDECPFVAHGRNEVASLYSVMNNLLGQKKVEVITADTVLLPHGCIQIVCQGVMYFRKYRRVFLHVFVLEPTLYRTKTYHIASDYLRFVNSEVEVIPEGSVVVAADMVSKYMEDSHRRAEEEQRRKLMEFQQRIRQQQQQQQHQQQQQQKPQQHREGEVSSAMAIPAPASRQGRPAAPYNQQQQQQQRFQPKQQQPSSHRPGNPEDRMNRGPRDGRERRDGHPTAEAPGLRDDRRRLREDKRNRDKRPEENAAAVSHQAAANSDAPKEKANPTGKQQGEGRPATAGEKGRRDNTPTNSIILLNVPKTIKLSDIKSEVLAQCSAATAQDFFWCGASSSHAVVKFSTVEMATELYKKKTFRVMEENVKIGYYRNP